MDLRGTAGPTRGRTRGSSDFMVPNHTRTHTHTHSRSLLFDPELPLSPDRGYGAAPAGDRGAADAPPGRAQRSKALRPSCGRGPLRHLQPAPGSGSWGWPEKKQSLPVLSGNLAPSLLPLGHFSSLLLLKWLSLERQGRFVFSFPGLRSYRIWQH